MQIAERTIGYYIKMPCLALSLAMNDEAETLCATCGTYKCMNVVAHGTVRFTSDQIYVTARDRMIRCLLAIGL